MIQRNFTQAAKPSENLVISLSLMLDVAKLHHHHLQALKDRFRIQLCNAELSEKGIN